MDSPIMYYALGVRTVIPMRMPGGVVADRSEGVHSPTSERRNLLETQYSRLTRTRTGGVELERISRVDSRIEGGGSRKWAVALLGAHTPSKNLPPISGMQAY